jgi:UDP:flavonoid glycosyltransferase YjiC (YdhE family)
MKIVCLPNCAFLSETSRLVAIYKELREIDAPVIMATHGGTFEFVLRDEKIPYQKIEPYLRDPDCRRYLKTIHKPWISLFSKSRLTSQVKFEIDLFKSVQAVAVITGFNLPSALSARYLGIPLVVTHLGSFVPLLIEKKMLAFSECFDNWLTRLIPDEEINRFFTWLFPHLPFQLRLFNTVAEEIGVGPIRSFFDLMMGDFTLVTDVPEILKIPQAEMHAWKPSAARLYRPSARIKYAGAIFARLFGEIPKSVRTFLITKKPKIFVAMASGKAKNLKRVYDTISAMDVRAVFCSMVNDNTFVSHGNILVADFLPSHLVMPLCDLAIIHGGQGSVQTAISAGIPIIGFPIQPEQNFNLKQVERHGAGLCLSLRNLHRGHLKEAIDQVLGDSGYRKSMQQLQFWQGRRDGASEVAKIVSSLITDRNDGKGKMFAL